MITEYIKKIQIGNVVVKNNVFLAPMAGVTDPAFRSIVREFSPGLTFTEMASSKAMEYGSEKTEKILAITQGERPSIVQIFGSNKHVICNMIVKLNEMDHIDIIDINMGCPAPKLVKNGDGAGLLLDLKNVEEILTEAVRVSKKPITVKTRKGFNDSILTAVEVAKIAEKCGVSMITIHGRTREQYYSGTCDLDVIKAVKEAVSIPVVGNGDIMDVQSAEKMFAYTKCDAIMIARGAEGNPWIFKNILQDGQDTLPTNQEKLTIVLKHINQSVAYDGDHLAKLKLRKHMAWYLKGVTGGAMYREKINKSNSIDEIKEIMKEALSN